MCTVITVENLGKKYTISHQQREEYSCLRDVIADGARSLSKKIFSPFTPNLSSHINASEDFWALKDVSFEVKQGDRIGIIGRNGAGKSTLLKILSRITEPTTGSIRIKGRIASLLEVGTGFHPELTGRENIYLNGAILGMRREEIRRKFDEIVDFAEIKKFLDTPVKRYSSGMYVRLAFAVAAHMEPEILIVDEVLAVGDVQFQKKCLGKMEDAGKEGRTILFVSHNMGTLLSLCSKGILLDQGKLVANVNIKDAVNHYLYSHDQSDSGFFTRDNYDPSNHLIKNAEILDKNMSRNLSFEYGEELNIIITTNSNLKDNFGLEARIKNSRQELIGYISSWIKGDKADFFKPGETIQIKIPKLKLVQDDYYIDFICRIPLAYHIDNWWDRVHFTISNCRPGGSPVSLQNTDQLGSIVFDETIVMSFQRC